MLRIAASVKAQVVHDAEWAGRDQGIRGTNDINVVRQKTHGGGYRTYPVEMGLARHLPHPHSDHEPPTGRRRSPQDLMAGSLPAQEAGEAGIIRLVNHEDPQTAEILGGNVEDLQWYVSGGKNRCIWSGG